MARRTSQQKNQGIRMGGGNARAAFFRID